MGLLEVRVRLICCKVRSTDMGYLNWRETSCSKRRSSTIVNMLRIALPPRHATIGAVLFVYSVPQILKEVCYIRLWQSDTLRVYGHRQNDSRPDCRADS